MPEGHKAGVLLYLVVGVLLGIGFMLLGHFDTRSVLVGGGVSVACIVGIVLVIQSEIKAGQKREAEEQARAEAVQAEHQAAIWAKVDEWGQETCQLLANNQFKIGMTSDMIRLALGEPTNIDQQDVTSRSVKERWVYGIPRQGASYIYFRNGEVTRIQGGAGIVEID